MGKIKQFDYPVHHRLAKGNQAVERSEDQTIHELLKENIQC